MHAPDFIRLNGYEFTVQSATLEANLRPDMFYWSLRVFAEGRIGDDFVEPYAYSENLLPLFNRRLQRWEDALASSIVWPSGYDGNEFIGNLYLYSHDSIDRSVMRFTPGIGRHFRLTWSGTVDINADVFDDYDDVPFHCDTSVEYVGVFARGLDIPEAHSRLADYFTAEPYSYESSDHGYHRFVPSS